MKPRLAVLVGVTFVVVAIVFYLLPVLGNGHLDYAGLTMILALSVAMSMMFYVLMAGSPRDS
jgi:hypothetical protein